MNIEYLYHFLLSLNLQVYRYKWYNVNTGKVNFIDSQKETVNVLQLFPKQSTISSYNLLF